MVQLRLIAGESVEQPPPLLDRPCEADPDAMFFDTNTTEDQDFRTYLRERVCGQCSFFDECLRGAIERDERYGMWAGIDFKWERFLINTQGQQRTA